MIIKNPLNYTGSKDRILPQLLKNLDYSKGTFIDFFCGSGVVGANVLNDFDRVVLNDGCWQIIELLNEIHENPNFIEEVEDLIKEYNLGKNNKEEFLKLREIYNNSYCKEVNFNPIMLYTLIMHGFNYFAIFNKDEGFSVPSGAGRSYFNSNIRKKLEIYQNTISNKDVEFYSFKMQDFIKVIKESYKENEIKDVMIYLDPPYSACCSDSSVSRSYGLKWSESEDLILMDFCDWLSENGASFALSNVLENNGKANKRLHEWAVKYDIVPVELDYNNCHFQRKNAGSTKEVIIKNF